MPEKKNDLLALADRCVKCGLCQPACPTYGLTGNESESPRGRIALIEGLLRGQLELDERLIGHLDHCLQCRRCEARCPSGVPYGRIIDATWQQIGRPAGRLERMQMAVITRPRLSVTALRLARHLPRLPGIAPELQQAAGKAAGFRRFRHHYPVHGAARGRVGLFLGCIARTTQNAALHAAIGLLTRLGYEVLVPARQGCCGALHAHSGAAGQAARLAAHNQAVFSGQGLDAVVSLASGCGQHLDASGQAGPHQDISRFLADSGRLDQLKLRPLPARALLHTPCSLAADIPVAGLLAHIPALQLTPLSSGYGCCGAAGRHLLSPSGQGQQLRAPLLDDVRHQAPDYLLTSNPGCALHLAAGMTDGPIEVLHPVELLLRQCTTDDESA